MKRFVLILFVTLCIINPFLPASADQPMYPQTLPIYQVAPPQALSIDQMQQVLSIFYGDQYTALRFGEESYKKRGIAQWRNDSLGLIANFSNAHMRLTKDTQFTIINTNMGGGYRDELSWHKEEGLYTFEEALNMANAMLSAIGVTEGAPLDLIHVYYDDPSMTKKRQNYYSFVFVPMFSGIPLSYEHGMKDLYGNQNGTYVEVNVANEGIVEIKITGLPFTISGVFKNVQIIDPQAIDLTQVHDIANQEAIRMIFHPTAEDYKLVSDRLFYDSKGGHYSKAVTSFAPAWHLLYVTRPENGQLLLKPIWLLTALEFEERELDEAFSVLFDAETGDELLP